MALRLDLFSRIVQTTRQVSTASYATPDTSRTFPETARLACAHPKSIITQKVAWRKNRDSSAIAKKVMLKSINYCYHTVLPFRLYRSKMRKLQRELLSRSGHQQVHSVRLQLLRQRLQRVQRARKVPVQTWIPR